MAFKVVLSLVFLSPLLCLSASKHIDRNKTSVLQENLRTNPNEFVLVNPKQVHRLEATIHRFLSNLAVPIGRQIVLRSTSADSEDLQLTIREIGQSIRQKLMDLAKEIGLDSTVEQFEQSLENILLSDDWYSEMILQNAFMVEDLGNMINEIASMFDRYIGTENLSSKRNKELSRKSNNFKFLGVVDDAAEFGAKLAQCLLQMADTKKYEPSFNLNRRIINLTKNPPKIFLQILKNRAHNSSYARAGENRAWQKPWHAFLCLSLMNNGETNYAECTSEVRRLESCLRSMRLKSDNETKGVELKSWTRAIRRLTDCQIRVDKNGEAEVSCKSVRRIPKNIKQKIKYVLERVLDKKISRSSPFHRVANNLGNTLSKSVWGQKLIDELCQYISIFVDGKMKMRRLSIIEDKDKRAVARHKEISKALEIYKRGALLRTFGSIKKIHRSVTDLQKLFAQGTIKIFNEVWQTHMEILSSMMNWMSTLLEVYSSDSDDEQEQTVSQAESSDFEDSNSENLEEFRAIARSKSDILRDVDNSINSLMESMNRLSRHKRANDKSTVTCIANNVLLVTILMETIGFVSSLFCLTYNESDQSPLEFEDEWKRARRSLLSLEAEKNIDLISSEHFSLEMQENSTAPIYVQI